MRINFNLNFPQLTQHNISKSNPGMSISQNDNEKYDLFLQWFTENGGKFTSINFPTRFPPTDYIGISAIEDIPSHKVILAVPKHLIIGVSTVRQSQLKQIISNCPLLHDEQNDDLDFNLLTLFLIMQKMKGINSFYYPYLRLVTDAQTLIHWTDDQIQQLADPYLNLSFINQIRSQFQPPFQEFVRICQQNPQIFPSSLTRNLFDQCYAIVMTRCFGWGLPETMIVPFADFFNHHNHGVHHYVFSKEIETYNGQDKSIEQQQNTGYVINQEPKSNDASKYAQIYVKKGVQLNLSLLGINNQSKLPIGYELNSRQKMIFSHKTSEQPSKNLSSSQIHKQMEQLTINYLSKHYKTPPLLLSSDSQDNDSNSNDSLPSIDEEDPFWTEQQSRFIRERTYFRNVNKIVKGKLQPPFQEPRPVINRQFEEGIDFSWWYSVQDSQFIVATSQKMQKSEQIYNSYGRRSNRFLLLWYGFTYLQNKYDSIPFRMWAYQIQQETGRRIFTRQLTEIDYHKRIAIGNHRYPYTMLSSEFRLKLHKLQFEFMAYLRYRIIRKDEVLTKKYLKRQIDIARVDDLINIEYKMLRQYFQTLQLLQMDYGSDKDRNFTHFPPHRQYFASILIQSNKQILQAHMIGIAISIQTVKTLIEVLFNSQKQSKRQILRQTLLSCHLKQFHQQQKQISMKIQNRLFVREYFNLIHEYIDRNQL